MKEHIIIIVTNSYHEYDYHYIITTWKAWTSHNFSRLVSISHRYQLHRHTFNSQQIYRKHDELSRWHTVHVTLFPFNGKVHCRYWVTASRWRHNRPLPAALSILAVLVGWEWSQVPIPLIAHSTLFRSNIVWNV